MAFFTSRADLNVGIVNQYVLNSNGIIQGQGQQVINFFNPTGGLPIAPSNGDRYISTATANGWVNNNIEVYDATLGGWKNMVPVAGTFAWLSSIAVPQLRVWNPTSGLWENPAAAMGAVVAVPSTDNAIVRFNGVGGQVQNSGVTIDDSNNVVGILNANIAGNVFVGGTITSTTTKNLVVTDQFINLNNGNTSGVGVATGITMNYLTTGISTTSILPGFTPAVPATSDAQIATLAAGPLWVAGDIVQVSGSVSNDGIYEVQSHAANVLSLKSVGLNLTTLDFVQDQLVAEATVGADIVGVNITVFQTGPTGVLEYATGNKAADFVYMPIGGSMTQVFTTVGTTVNDVPNNVSNVRVTMFGGGGGGGSGSNLSGSGAGGGGSGAAIVGFVREVTPGVGTMTITVAAGGPADTVGGNSIVAYTGSNPFTITAYGGGPGGNGFLNNDTGGGGGGSAASTGDAGIPSGTGNGGIISTAGFILSPAGAYGGDSETADGTAAQPGSQGQYAQFVQAGSGGGGGGYESGTPGRQGGYMSGNAPGNSTGQAGSGAAGFGGSGGDAAIDGVGQNGGNAANNSGAGGGGAFAFGTGGTGGSGKVVLEYF
jgi:hypothetical protein